MKVVVVGTASMAAVGVVAATDRLQMIMRWGVVAAPTHLI
jgi:hypothetical protein